MPHHFNHTNVRTPARVYDVETRQEIEHVLEINTRAGWLKVADRPVRLASNKQLASHRIRFRAIHAIHGGDWLPGLFHCYGRIEEPAS